MNDDNPNACFRQKQAFRSLTDGSPVQVGNGNPDSRFEPEKDDWKVMSENLVSTPFLYLKTR